MPQPEKGHCRRHQDVYGMPDGKGRWSCFRCRIESHPAFASDEHHDDEDDGTLPLPPAPIYSHSSTPATLELRRRPSKTYYTSSMINSLDLSSTPSYLSLTESKTPFRKNISRSNSEAGDDSQLSRTRASTRTSYDETCWASLT